MKKTIRDYDLNNKKVIIRCDFNVPIKEGKIIDDNRIVQSLTTINYAIEHNAKLILMSHLGRIKEEEDKASNSLRLVATRLSELLGKEVKFSPVTRGPELENLVNSLNPLMIENELKEIFKEEDWVKLHKQFVLFGRYKCKSIKPDCLNCKLKNICNNK